MKIFVCGASGFVGTELVKFLTEQGHQVIGERRPPEAFPQVDAVVHLGGKNIASGRWTSDLKREILESRIQSTRQLVSAMRRAQSLPKVFVCASAVGFYGKKRSEILTEDAAAGDGFLAEVCKAWEAEAVQAANFAVRVVNLRCGMILGRKGGALKNMLLPFKFGLGGKLGSGAQHVSWISLTDTVRAILHCIEQSSLSGPVNIVAPQVLTNAEFTRALGAALHRPTFCTIPAFALRLLLDEMAEELLLSDLKVAPQKLRDSAFVFEDSEIEQAMSNLIKSV